MIYPNKNMKRVNFSNFSEQHFLEQKELISMLEKFSYNSVQGCLTILSFSQTISLFFEKGQLIYVYHSSSMWEIFYDKLQQLFPHLNNLNNELGGQLEIVFNTKTNAGILDRPDYLTICWLVEKHYLNSLQAGTLIEEMTVKILNSFFNLGNAAYQFIPQSLPDNLPKFCYLDIPLLINRCQLRSINSTNVNNYEQAVSSNHLKLFSDLERELALKKTQLIQNKINQNKINSHSLITQKLEKNAIKNNESNSNQNQPKLYKVLCVDDNPTILLAIKKFLDEQTFTVITIGDPLKALMQILRVKPDIILLDIFMPNLDGYELCSLLRKHPDFRNIPVVMVTGRTGIIDRARAKIVGASGYLSKPFNKADLLKIVFSHIGYIA